MSLYDICQKWPYTVFCDRCKARYGFRMLLCQEAVAANRHLASAWSLGGAVLSRFQLRFIDLELFEASLGLPAFFHPMPVSPMHATGPVSPIHVPVPVSAMQ